MCTGTIVVNMRDNTQRTYGSKFNLELVDFEVEDGNGDGVLEPGEFAYIKRIRVRNSGEFAVREPSDDAKE